MFTAIERPTGLRSSHRTATTAQQFCSKGSVETLMGCDGISKTMMWKN
jgi:hypothetical protein